MANSAKDIPTETLYDVRLVDRHIRAGLITRAQANEFFGKAKDMEAESEKTDIQAMESELHPARRRHH